MLVDVPVCGKGLSVLLATSDRLMHHDQHQLMCITLGSCREAKSLHALIAEETGFKPLHLMCLQPSF